MNINTTVRNAVVNKRLKNGTVSTNLTSSLTYQMLVLSNQSDYLAVAILFVGN